MFALATSEPVGPVAPLAEAELRSVFDMVMNGGPLMVPIAFCSVVALAYVVERSVRLRPGELGTRVLGREILATLEAGGPAAALRLCRERDGSLARVLAAGLARTGAPAPEVEKAVEDAGEREVRRLSANLRPLVVIGMIAPLLGLLGTVWGMIEAFSSIALQGGLGKPELLASGISQALVTTAAGLAIAIPAQAATSYFRGRIDRFARAAEDLYLELESQLARYRRPELVAHATVEPEPAP
jgi:biopolymer transport protein ExbB